MVKRNIEKNKQLFIQLRYNDSLKLIEKLYISVPLPPKKKPTKAKFILYKSLI
jgi:hypothetical protein